MKDTTAPAPKQRLPQLSAEPQRYCKDAMAQSRNKANGRTQRNLKSKPQPRNKANGRTQRALSPFTRYSHTSRHRRSTPPASR